MHEKLDMYLNVLILNVPAVLEGIQSYKNKSRGLLDYAIETEWFTWATNDKLSADNSASGIDRGLWPHLTRWQPRRNGLVEAEVDRGSPANVEYVWYFKTWYKSEVRTEDLNIAFS